VAPRTVIIMIVGAGRGPFIRRSLRASEMTKVPVKIIAVEKNPNAIVTLKNMIHYENMKNVAIVSGDMRQVQIDEKADIIVSELLGSFGDNELSPECLYPTERFMHDDTIYIPCYYKSLATPISSQVLWNDINQMTCPMPYEVGYVVKIFSASYPSEEFKQVFEFEHPAKNIKNKSTKQCLMKFTSKKNTMLHGFGGYFEAKLYQDVWISTNPETHTPKMASWFPIYFPIDV
jgi:protein arginine N-methyltransferase 5